MKKKISAVLAISMIASSSMPAINVFADEVIKEKVVAIEKQVSKNMSVTDFNIRNNSNFNKYGELYKVKITSITNNGGAYNSSSVLENAIDGDLKTHWETGNRNTDSFKNEVILELEEVSSVNRLAYATRQDDKGKGYPIDAEIYTSASGDENDFVLAGSVTGTKATGNMVEFRFDTVKAKKVKFVFEEAHREWASAAEFWLYKEDEVLDSMERLFTDDTMSEVSQEFASASKLDDLENKIKDHPFRDSFVEYIENARKILEDNSVEFAETKVSKLLGYGTEYEEAYNKEFMLPYENITNFEANGGTYGTSKAEYMYDGKYETHWESNRHNDANFTNEVVFTFDKIQNLDRIALLPRSENQKGFPTNYEIYASETSKGETFKLVSKGTAEVTSDFMQFKFNPTNFKRLKFVFKDCYKNKPFISEARFYKEDDVAYKANNLFTDDLKNELVPEFDSLEELRALEEEVMQHPLKEELMVHINMAKALIENPEETKGRVYEVESRGNTGAESQKRKVWNFRDWLPTGLAVKSGEKITVYVDSKAGEPVPNLIFKQMDSTGYGLKDIPLKRGKNEITIPKVDEPTRPGKPSSGVLYISNSYTTEQQTIKPRLRIVGGVAYPHYVKGETTDEQVMKDLENYTKKLEQDQELPDVFEVFSDKTLVNTTATYALDWYTDNDKLPSYTANKHDEIIKETMDFWGFDGSKEEHSDFNFRYVLMLKNLKAAFMDAANGITGYNLKEQAGALNGDSGWGFMHEMGHNFDTTNRDIQEVTNNILPLHYQMLRGERSRISEQNLWEKRIFPNVSKENYSDNVWYPDNDRSALTHLAPLWQLQLYDNTFWPRFEQQFRERDINGKNWDEIHASWAVVASDVLQLDLTEHFARHGFYVDKATENHMSKYKKPDKKLWYLNDNKYLKEGQGFNDELDCDLTVKVNPDSTKLTMSIDSVNENSLLGYEIVRDGKVVGFTTQSSFVDTTATPETNHEYKVIPYDINMNPAEGTIIKSHKPFIETVGGVTLALNEKFNPLDYVKATDYKGDELKDVKYTTNVDIKNKGNYTVNYEVTTEGVTTKEVLNVTVASKYDYLSDREWDSAVCPEVTPTRNTSVKGNSLGEVKSFDKGFRMHAVGKAVYNLGEHNYDELEVKVGVDMNVPAQNSSSVSFRIVGDGETLATSEVLTREDNLQYIKVPIKGVNELVLEFNDGGNGNRFDHATMVEPKLITNDTKPELTIPKSQTVKIGETLDNLAGDFEAIDIEDGNLTNSVVVTGTEKVNLNRVGNYIITYTVTDKDGNTVEKERIISVVHPEDFKYLSDYEWKSASSSGGQVYKDKSTSNNKLKLTGENGEEVIYDKGIGTHAVSTIVYDLTDENVNTFSSFIGVDRKVYDRNLNVSFEVHLDGKEVYNSGVMNSKDKQKFVEVNLEGAKELKLIVKNGGDGASFDHANWADAKLYFINKDRVDTADLTKAIEEAKKLDKDAYTEESMKTLEDKLAKAEALMNEETPSQEAIDTATNELKEAIKAMIEINLEEVVNVPDEYLAKVIRSELNKEGDLTIGDMRNLEHLDVGYGVVSLEGLQYAKNLKTITGESNEVKDLRPLAKLKKLTKVNFENQYVAAGELNIVDGKIKVNTEAYNRDGENIARKVALLNMTGEVLKEQTLDGTTKEVDLDVKGIQSGFYAVHVTFEDPELSGTLLYMASI